MNSAPLPRDEPKRLKDLRSYAVLDTTPEPAYDDATSLAAQICGTPISLVSFVDEERQWFKSRHGLDATETPRTISFCAHSILGEGLFEVRDAALDTRFRDNPLVVGGPRIRFYAGVPLVTESGSSLGTLCVIDSVPRALTTEQREALSRLAAQVVRTLELRKRNRELHEAMDKVRTRGRVIADQRARLFHAEKLASLGAMCASLSHEINNPLSVVCGRAEQLQLLFSGPERSDAYVVSSLEAIRRSAYRIGGIVKGLRSYARQAEGDPFEVVSLSSILTDLRSLVWERFRSSGITLSIEAEGQDVALTCRPTQVLQILFNLLSNAYDAVVSANRAGDGRVRLTCERVGEGEEALVEVRVSDNGCGVPAHVRGRIMAPFFTTKPAGKGTGLGLAISLGLARAHGGELELEGAEGPTMFVLRLPLVPPQTREAEESHVVAQDARTGSHGKLEVPVGAHDSVPAQGVVTSHRARSEQDGNVLTLH